MSTTIMVNLPPAVADLLEHLYYGINLTRAAALVGGAVRDGLLSKEIKDYDILVQVVDADAARAEYLTAIQSAYPDAYLGDGSEAGLPYIVIPDVGGKRTEILLTTNTIREEINEYPDSISQLAVFASTVGDDNLGELYLTTAALNSIVTRTITVYSTCSETRRINLAHKYPEFSVARGERLPPDPSGVRNSVKPTHTPVATVQ